MPIDLKARMAQVASAQPAGKGGKAKGIPYHELFQPIPEGGNGVVKGRDIAAVSLIGHLKHGGMEYGIALNVLQLWNRQYCQPPLDEGMLADKMSRLWVTMEEPSLESVEIDPAAPPFEFLDMEGLWKAAEAEGQLGWVVGDMIPVGALVYVTAPPGVGKSWVALDLMRSALTGGRWFGKWEVEKTPVMYIDEEIGARFVKSRMERLGVPMTAPIHYTKRAGVRFDNPVHLKWIVERVRSQGIKLVIVDSLSRIHDMREDSNDDMKRLYRCFLEVMSAGATLVVIHHDRKGGQGESAVRHDRSRGAGDIMGQADMVYSVEKVDGALKFACTKSRHIPEDRVPGCTFEVVDSEDGQRVSVCALDHTTISSRRLDSTEEAVVNYLRAVGTSNVNRMVSDLKMAGSRIRAALASLVDGGEVISQSGPHGSTVYYLKPKDVPEGIF